LTLQPSLLGWVDGIIPSREEEIMSRAWERLLARVIEEAGQGRWTAVSNTAGLPTIRHDKITPTPATVGWSDPTYPSHVFITLINRKVILGRAPAPWVGRLDGDIPLWLAEAILDDPEVGHDSGRMLALKDERAAGVRS
jgi:hypothetical protein